MADASTGKGVFRLNGDLNGGGGGSCITIPASAEHDISGNVNLAGGARLGAGTYTVDGFFSVNTGGSACSDNIAVSARMSPLFFPAPKHLRIGNAKESRFA